jgi:hypothetical protein
MSSAEVQRGAPNSFGARKRMPTPLCLPVAIPAAGLPIDEFADPDEHPAEQAALAADADRVRRLVTHLHVWQ